MTAKFTYPDGRVVIEDRVIGASFTLAGALELNLNGLLVTYFKENQVQIELSDAYEPN